MPSFVPNRTESMPKMLSELLVAEGGQVSFAMTFTLTFICFDNRQALLELLPPHLRAVRGWSPGCFLQVSMGMPNTRGRPNLPKSICASYAHFSSCAGMVASTLCREFISDESQNRDLRVPSWRSCMSFFAVSRSCACDRSLSQPC